MKHSIDFARGFLADVAQRLEAKLVEHATRPDVKP
jgi:hypothetical protein